MNEKTKIRAYAFLGVLAVAFLFAWLNDRAERLTLWADAYEACVEAQYGRTPASYYQEHGEYPTCDVAPTE